MELIKSNQRIELIKSNQLMGLIKSSHDIQSWHLVRSIVTLSHMFNHNIWNDTK